MHILAVILIIYLTWSITLVRVGFILTLLFLNKTDKISIHSRARAGITDLLR